MTLFLDPVTEWIERIIVLLHDKCHEGNESSPAPLHRELPVQELSTYANESGGYVRPPRPHVRTPPALTLQLPGMHATQPGCFVPNRGKLEQN